MSPILVVGLAGIALTAAASGWALLLRAELAEYRSAYEVLSVKAKEQSAVVGDLERRGATARATGRQALERAAAEAQGMQAEIARLSEQLAAPTPAGNSCAEALQEIRGRL